MTVKYTDAMIAELKEVGKFNYEIAQVFADKYNIQVRSVIAKVKSLELTYVVKSPTERKAGVKAKTRSKAEIVASIELSCGAKMASMSNMTIADLLILENVFA